MITRFWACKLASKYKATSHAQNMLASHLENSGGLLNRLNQLHFRGKKMASFDVKALFTNVPLEGAGSGQNIEKQIIESQNIELKISNLQNTEIAEYRSRRISSRKIWKAQNAKIAKYRIA